MCKIRFSTFIIHSFCRFIPFSFYLSHSLFLSYFRFWPCFVHLIKVQFALLALPQAHNLTLSCSIRSDMLYLILFCCQELNAISRTISNEQESNKNNKILLSVRFGWVLFYSKLFLIVLRSGRSRSYFNCIVLFLFDFHLSPSSTLEFKLRIRNNSNNKKNHC